MKTIVFAIILGLVALLGSGCIMDEKVIEIVLTGETYADFVENEDGADEAETATIDMADALRDILEDNDLSLSDIEEAFVTSVHYGVTSFSQAHDWTISGAISVRRVDGGGPLTVIANYTAQSVQGALGQKIPATLEPAGVDVINTALADFLAGGNPILEFQVQSGTIVPVPSAVDPMVFNWRAWLAIQLITTQTVEVPDPF